MNRKERIARFKEIDIYPVTCQDLSNGRTDLDVLDGVLAGGARVVQLREKHWEKRELYELGLEFRKKTLKYDALLIINDHLDIALALKADGVHLGQDDLPIKAAREIASELLLGASSHSLKEAIQGETDGADYVNIGPIFPTKTKDGLSRFLGPDAIREVELRLNIPFTTMGGINERNIHELLHAGARRVAMVTGIIQAPDIASRVRELRKIIRAYS
ncbi:MAG: thiamine phosphate synthase [Thermodesulfobacteriota bacterium]|nr:thiamine phosphate synthase [Thermodesulfobacteriota bacterium]